VSNLLAPLPSRMVGLTLQSLPSQIDPHPSLPLQYHPLRLRPQLPLRLLLPQRSTGRASQSSFSPYRHLPLRQLPPQHDLYRYLPKLVRLSHTSPPTRQMPHAKAKMVILPLLGPPFIRVPWRMAKPIASVSVVGRKLVLAVPMQVPRPRLCLVRG
jgi:hypothetical protein